VHGPVRSWRAIMVAVLVVAWLGASASAQGVKVASLTITLPAWIAMPDGEERAAWIEEIRPLAREHRFTCRSPEAFVLPDVSELAAVLAALLPYLPEGPKAVPLHDEERRWVAELMGGGMMFHRLLIVETFEGEARLLVC
jgi:hypothetical protein